ncbi:fructosamine kinase family protein [Maribacter chungangensis]|uniref:Fructosamine kinase family protein n=1 Tax=Maribacter chungangensis TaxID=1069117 RepID=A0ABW3B8Y1_9FLAO
MDKTLKAHVEYLLCIRIERVTAVSGGDISKAFLLETDTERFFCKVNSNTAAFEMFKAEKEGLAAIAATKTIATPKVLLCETWETGGFLLMDYLEAKPPRPNDMELFGHQLAALHQLSNSDTFGFPSDNYIGCLPQSNKEHLDWAGFYVEQRLRPQLRMARNAQLLSSKEIPSETELLKICETLLPKVEPSLLHGDLWSGNYLIAQNGTPYLIDPAVCFGHSEMDLAMTRLFGGFNSSFYDAYNEHYPKIGGKKERCDIYQLYYLLVHLNLFGASYHRRCKEILQRYFF